MENARGWSLGVHGSLRQPYKYVIVIINPPLQSQVPSSPWSRLLSLRKKYEKSCGTKKGSKVLTSLGTVSQPAVVIKMSSRNAAVWVWWKSALMSCAAFEASFKLCQLDEAEFHPQGSVFRDLMRFVLLKKKINLNF